MYKRQLLFLLSLSVSIGAGLLASEVCTQPSVLEQLKRGEVADLSPILLQPEISVIAGRLEATLVAFKEAAALLDDALPPFANSRLTSKDYKQALKVMGKLPKPEVVKKLPKSARKDLARLADALKRGVTEFLRLRPYTSMDKRVVAARWARATAQKNAWKSRLSKAAIVLSVLVLGAGAGYGGWQWYKHRREHNRNYENIPSEWGAYPDFDRLQQPHERYPVEQSGTPSSFGWIRSLFGQDGNKHNTDEI